jgi:hypothetical protein
MAEFAYFPGEYNRSKSLEGAYLYLGAKSQGHDISQKRLANELGINLNTLVSRIRAVRKIFSFFERRE